MNRKLLIGSKAIKHWYGEDYKFPIHDTDYICAEKIEGTDTKYCSSYQRVLEYYPNEDILPPDGIYSMILSCCFWRGPHFEKRFNQLLFLQSKNCKCIDELFYPLRDEAAERYGKKKNYLNIENSKFFGPQVGRKYLHDDLHFLVKFYDEPMYEKIKKDKSKAVTSLEMFNKLSHEDKIKDVLEEAFVISLERWIIPDEKIPPRVAYIRALKLILTSLFTGEWSKFVALNLTELVNWKDFSYIEKFNNAVKEGSLKPINI